MLLKKKKKRKGCGPRSQCRKTLISLFPWNNSKSRHFIEELGADGAASVQQKIEHQKRDKDLVKEENFTLMCTAVGRDSTEGLRADSSVLGHKIKP